ncbi:alpha-ketoacid dehydrogenase subunit beta [bacterium]|nr:alpha-ketoacid dehydrogenase subunit beta [candidate division CSSED10-310 bacterium]
MSEKTQKLTLIQGITQALRQEMERDAHVLILGEDVGRDGGVFRATDGLIEAFGDERVMDTPLAESGIIGISVGLAAVGYRPVAEIQFMGFIYPAMNQILAHVARFRHRSRGRIPMPLVIRMPYGGGIHAPEHHSESYEAMLANTPGLTVVIPSTPYDAKGLLTAAIRSDDPVIFMEPKRIYRSFREDVPATDYEVPLRQAVVRRTGTDVTLIGYGAMMRPVMEAAEFLARESVSAEVIDVRTVMPLDIETILASAEKTGRVVIVHEAPGRNGFGAELSALIAERALLHLLAPVQRVTGFDTVFPFAMMEDHYLPHRGRIVAAVQRTLAF